MSKKPGDTFQILSITQERYDELIKKEEILHNFLEMTREMQTKYYSNFNI